MVPGSYYHIYNRGINKELIFFEDENYSYFLQRFKKYLSEYIDVFAYCLMPNHFHFFIRVKEVAAPHKNSKLTAVEKAFKDFFISYAKSINKRYNRTGALFQYKFKRKEVKSESHYTWLIYYVHLNPVKARLSSGFNTWQWSSYASLLSSQLTLLQREEVVSRFGNREELIKFHENNLKEQKEQQDFIKQFQF